MQLNKVFLVFVFALLIIPVVAGETFKEGVAVDIKVPVVLNGAPSPNVVCNMTVLDPTNIIVVDFLEMTNQVSFHNFTLNNTQTTPSGIYSRIIFCTDGVLNETQEVTFEINPSGKEYIPDITGPLLFVGIIVLLFVSGFLFFISTFMPHPTLKFFFIVLSGIFAIVSVGYVAGAMQEFFSTGSTLATGFGAFYILFLTLLGGASVFLILWLFIMVFKSYQRHRGLIG